MKFKHLNIFFGYILSYANILINERYGCKERINYVLFIYLFIFNTINRQVFVHCHTNRKVYAIHAIAIELKETWYL